MSNPIRRLLDQCKVGFTVSQKFWLTVGAIVYFISPIDVLIDVLPPITYADDAFVLYLAIKGLCSPTLPRRDGSADPAPADPASTALATTQAASTCDARRNCTVIDREEV